MKKWSIVIADDHPIIRTGLRSLLQSQEDCDVVAEAANGREAVARVKEFHPDLILLDISMPELNGLDAARLIRHDSPETRILFLTMHSAEELVAKTLQAGAHGYVLKSDAERDLVSAVKAILAGRTYFTRAASEVMLATARHGHKPKPHLAGLSVRESEVLQLLAEGKSNKEVAAVLGISTRTAENHRAKIMAKLGISSLSDLVRYAIRNKIVEP